MICLLSCAWPVRGACVLPNCCEDCCAQLGDNFDLGESPLCEDGCQGIVIDSFNDKTQEMTYFLDKSFRTQARSVAEFPVGDGVVRKFQCKKLLIRSVLKIETTTNLPTSAPNKNLI